MVALVGLLTILAVFIAIFSKKVSPMVALIAVPIIAALILGVSPPVIAKYAVGGIREIAPTIGMFVFAIIFFGVMTDAGMMDPIIERILRTVGMKPARITMGATLLALLIHLDGSGAVTFLIAIPAMLPLFERLQMDKRILALVVSLAAGVNFLPWTGPVLRSASSISKVAGHEVTTIDIFTPLIAVQLVGIVFMFAVAYILGKKEERRLGLTDAGFEASIEASAKMRELSEAEQKIRRPKLFWVNIAITLIVLGTMISGYISPTIMFMVGCVVALVINYPNEKDQKGRVDAHAKAALMMASILFAAGVFTGIMGSTKMLAEMAAYAANHIPDHMAQHMPFAVGIVSMPLSLLFDPDSYYYGVMPVVAEVYKSFGGNPIEIAQASILGQMTTGFPVSPLTPATFLVVGLTGVSLADHQKYAIPYLFGATVIMTIAAALIGIFPF
ncbi:citrate:proton symporter [Microvirga sp. W0021]|uniref:Citrate:proton symporter n=1 Tax=Hohaiivirga grylli TaxID=3133970 RepID=A0ABV0BHV8_9HYPH